MAALERQDLVSDSGMQTIPELTAQLTALLSTLDDVKTSSKGFSDGLKDAGLPKLKTDTEGLTQAQIELAKVQAQISTVVAKNNDTWIANAQALKNAKDELKNNQATADSWTKSATVQNSSIIKLSEALDKNRIAYANLRTEQERSSKAGQDLLKTIQTQDTGVKALRDSMGQMQGHVGGYREEIEKLVPTLRRLSGPTADAAENFVLLEDKASFFSSSLAIGLGVVAAAVALVTGLFKVGKFAVEEYFNRSMEGADRANKINAIFSAGVEVVKDKFALLGEAIIDTFSSEKFLKHFTESIIALFPVLSAITLYFIKDSDILKELVEKYKQTLALAEVENELKRDQLKIGVEIAEQEKRRDKDLFDSRDKTRKSDQDRFEAALDQRKAIEEIIRLKLKENDLEIVAANKELLISGDSYKNEQRLSDLKAKRIHIEAELFQGQRRALQTIDSIEQETIVRQLDREKTTQDAIIRFREVTYKDIIDINKRIIGNQQYTVDQQIEAEKILSDATVGLIEVSASKELAAAKEAAIKRIQLTSDEQDKIFKQSNGNVLELARLERELKESKLKEDKEYQSQSASINEQVTIDKEKEARGEKDIIGKIIIDNGKYWLDLHKQLAEEDVNADIEALNKKFNSGQIGVVGYEQARLKLHQDAAERAVAIDLEEYKNQIIELDKYQAKVGVLDEASAKKLQELQKLYSKAELDETQLTADKKLALYKKAKSETIKIVNELANAIQASGDAQFAAEVAQSQARIDLLAKEHEQNVKAAGDNKNAIASLDRKYTKDLEVETAKQNLIKRKQALFDKEASIFKVISSTAAAIAQAYAEFVYPVATVFAALIAASGAIQIGAIDAAPLPSYATGTDDHPGGPAVVGHGLELVREPGYKPFLVSSPEIMNLVRGTEVLTESETLSVLAMAGLNRSTNDERQVPAIVFQTDKLEKAIDRLQQPDYFEQNREIMRAVRKRDGSRQITRAKWINRD